VTDRVLVVMAKAPRPGHVKTRLLEHAAADDVVELYRSLVEDTIAMAQTIAGLEIAVMCPIGDAAAIRAWLGGVDVVQQKGKGLADALTATFEHFQAKGRGRIIAFNSDSPHLPPDVLEGAFSALEANDLVVGPTADGGYYLVGARGAHATLFDGNRLGTSSALDALLERAGTLGLRVARTDPCYDVDVGADLEQLAIELRAHPERAPRTAAYLARHRIT